MSENRRRRPVNPPTSEPISAPQPSSYEAYQRPQNKQSYTPPRQPHYEQPRYEQPQNVIINQVSIDPNVGFGGSSYFDGGLLQLIGYGILAAIIITFTLGLGYPFAACMLYRWEAKHTVINGRRLRFDGTAMQLLGKWILWFFLTLITLGIYSFWLSIKLKQWRTKHTHFA